MRLLLVEDERPLAAALGDALRESGWVVDHAEDGVSGLKLGLASQYDVLVLDIMLPGMNGYDVLKHLRAHKVWTPVLMLTAKDGEFDQTDAFELGADDYVTKPFSTPVLLARLQALARRGAPERPVALTAGPLSLDPTTRRVTRAGQEVQLTAREYALLHHLMRKAGLVQSKAEILENVWDSDYPGADNVVEVYIGYLRRKIDAPFDTKVIETVRGLGYRLNPEAAPEA
ncbi:response regulator transcription factor [Phycicoccus endophyticus]|uniref:Response regulator transcription factor n=1 Tax=Phycicoccus endophyticus TaxID=1690220 RepID=A0A7G9R233_9MICO|nr:response regulator transcription factor [Phycicoccus endophyticus]NHI19696.1 response regulator transcription factor [Phycicoccus endophyticus]QNN49658.1 response regulator transcription factor [Phycicoccus endophyticus]GGL33754.1 DNA-binding response regulator [Phycicoccus endophyticus]